MKRKILACVLACATLFLGMGYAYWTDSLQIDTTATTGELEVNFVDLAAYGQYAGSGDHEWGWAIVDGVGTTGVTPDWYFGRGTQYNILYTDTQIADYNKRIWGYTQTTSNAYLNQPEKLDVTVGPYTTTTDASDTIKIDLRKIYPGFAQVYQADIVNTGTIAAKLADLKLTIDNTATTDTTVLDMIGVNFKVLREYAGDPSEGHVDVFDTTDLDTNAFFNLAGVDFIRLSALDDLLANKELMINDLLYVLPDDNRMDIYVGIAMDPDKKGTYTTGWTGEIKANDDSKTEIEGTAFQIQFLWDQFNIDNPITGDNGQLEDGQDTP